MEQDEEKEEKDLLGGDYLNYLNKEVYPNDIKNETLKDYIDYKGDFEKINEIKYYHPQTELNKEDQKTKKKNEIKHKNSINGNSSKDLFKILQKKTTRDGEKKTKKKKKTKTDMEISVKNKTEINYEDKKKENEKKLYDMFNNEAYIDVYEYPSPSGDLFNMIDKEEPNAEVNQEKPIYNTQLNHEIPESFNMIISSNY